VARIKVRSLSSIIDGTSADRLVFLASRTPHIPAQSLLLTKQELQRSILRVSLMAEGVAGDDGNDGPGAVDGEARDTAAALSAPGTRQSTRRLHRTASELAGEEEERYGSFVAPEAEEESAKAKPSQLDARLTRLSFGSREADNAGDNDGKPLSARKQMLTRPLSARKLGVVVGGGVETGDVEAARLVGKEAQMAQLESERRRLRYSLDHFDELEVEAAEHRRTHSGRATPREAAPLYSLATLTSMRAGLSSRDLTSLKSDGSVGDGDDGSGKAAAAAASDTAQVSHLSPTPLSHTSLSHLSLTSLSHTPLISHISPAQEVEDTLHLIAEVQQSLDELRRPLSLTSLSYLSLSLTRSGAAEPGRAAGQHGVDQAGARGHDGGGTTPPAGALSILYLSLI